MVISIRQATPGDISGIAELHIESWKTSYRGMLPDHFLDHELESELKRYWSGISIGGDDLILVAEERGIIGFIAVWYRPDPFIDNLHVRPGSRSQGIGRRLMMAAAEKLVAGGHKTAYLWVLENNERALKFYYKMGGFESERAIKPVIGINVVQVRFMWKNLGKILNYRIL